MKKTSIVEKDSHISDDDLLPEYNFDYTQARPNRFAQQLKGKQMAVVLDADIAEIFTTSESVNSVLRALMTTMPVINKKRPLPGRNSPR